MRVPVRPPRWQIDLGDVAAYALLAATAGVTSAIEAIAALAGDPVAPVTAPVLLLMTMAFGAALQLGRSGRRRAAAILGSLTLLFAVPVFGILYSEGRVLILVAPIAFVLALPHLRGRSLVAFAVLAILAALVTVMVPTTPNPPGAEAGVAFNTVGKLFGTVVACGLLLVLVLRTYRHSERQSTRYARLVADLPVGIVRVTQDGRLVEANEALVQMLRYPSRGVLLATPGSTVFGRLGSEVRDLVVSDGRGLRGVQVPVRRFDGTEGWIRVRMRMAHSDDGRLAWFDGAIEDASAERAEREAQNLLAAIVDSAPDAIYGLALDGTIQSWNDAAERLYGRSADEVLGRIVFENAPAEQHARIREVLERVAVGEHLGPFDTEQPHPDGRVLTLSVTASPTHDADGRISAVAVIARDMTEHRRLQVEQARLEGQLRQAQKMEAVGRLAGGIAHDFNNLLTAISGFGGLVAAELDGQLLDDQRQVLRAADRATELTQRLLAFSHHAPAAPRSVAIDAVLQDAFLMTRRLVPERIELEVDLRCGGNVVADPIEVEQVMLNLVVNAIDATPGAGRIRIETGLVDLGGPFVAQHLGSSHGRHVRIAVSDTGRGMDEVTRARIFEPFFTTKGRGEGTGLGLATVWAIVRRSGGTVWAESAPGEGSTFTVYLPVAESCPAPVEPAAPAQPGGSERILLVEDEEAVRTLAARILERAGYTVRVAASPSEAEAITQLATFDVIVSDVIMPGMSGPEFVDRLPADLPAVFISGYTGQDGLELHLDRPSRVLVMKPFEAAALTRAVRTVLDAAARGRRASRTTPDTALPAIDLPAADDVPPGPSVPPVPAGSAADPHAGS